MAPINGLENFLTGLKNAGVKMAMATSATVQDIDFIMGPCADKGRFRCYCGLYHGKQAKAQSADIFKSCRNIKQGTVTMRVFEDSLAGIKAANSAGMKVVGITTGHTADELHPVNLVIADYSELTVEKLAALFEK